jgi:hypothetical protein
MAITLAYSGTTVTLPDDLLWTDRHTWSPVEQSVATSITGAGIVDIGTRINGRSITLAGSESSAWMAYTLIDQLKAWAVMPGITLVLTIAGTPYSVIFRHHDAPALDVTPVIDYNAPDAQDWFYGTLKFMEI